MKRIASGLALVAAGSVFYTCQKYPFIYQGPGKIAAEQKDVTIDLPQESDILFVIDNSGSMQAKQDLLKGKVQSLVESLASRGNKFRVGITTTDTRDGTGASCSGIVIAGSDAVHNGICGHLLAPGTPGGQPGFLDITDFSTPKEMTTKFQSYIDTVDTGGSSWEEPLKAAYMALDPAVTADGQPNAGFLRKEAALVIAILTDESDCSFEFNGSSDFTSKSGETDGTACYYNASKLVTPEEWANRIIERKGDKRLVRVGLISSAAKDKNADGLLDWASCATNGQEGTSRCHCVEMAGFPDKDFCQYTSNAVTQPKCVALANDRLFNFANQFENVKDSICNASYEDALLSIADLADMQCFNLSQPPLNGDLSNIQIKMRRSGTTEFTIVPQITSSTGDGWYYKDGSPPMVCLSGSAKRMRGDTVRLLVLNQQEGEITSSTSSSAP